jgi:mRNA interferase HicA
MLARISIIVYYIYIDKQHGGAVKQSEFVRWLKQQGATFKDGSNHLKVYLNGEQTILPRHPSKELKTGLVEGVKKQLKLK